MHGGVFKAYVANTPNSAFTESQGYGTEGHPTQGLADPSATVYQEFLNDTTPSKLNAFVERAAAALSVNREALVVKDIHGNLATGLGIGKRGSSVEDGPVGQAQPYL